MRCLKYSVCVVFLLGIVSGCATGRSTYRSSAVDFLYPEGSKFKAGEEERIPQLKLPLKVGVAFAPGGKENYGGLSEMQKMEVMRQVSKEFDGLELVESIEIIPSTYLQPQGGFANVDQVATMYSLDILALISYDQSQFTDEGVLSLAYWTIVGLYVVSGEKNDTHTMLDTVVYDIPTRTLLFRAPGLSRVEGRATLANVERRLDEDRLTGFLKAAEEMTGNLKLELAAFQERVKAEPERYAVSYAEGYTGGGSLDLVVLAAMLLFGGAVCVTQRRSL